MKDDDDEEFEVVPLKPTKTEEDFSDGLYCGPMNMEYPLGGQRSRGRLMLT